MIYVLILLSFGFFAIYNIKNAPVMTYSGTVVAVDVQLSTGPQYKSADLVRVIKENSSEVYDVVIPKGIDLSVGDKIYFYPSPVTELDDISPRTTKFGCYANPPE